MIATPGWSKSWLTAAEAYPQEYPAMITYRAPSATAESVPVPASLAASRVVSTRRMWQLGQMAETMSMAADSFSVNVRSFGPPLGSVAGSGLAWPFSLTLVKQPLDV